MTASNPRSKASVVLRLASLLAALTVARSSAAGDAAAAAEALFSEGKRLVQEGNYAAACPRFEESQKLDPGVGTLYRLADCYEHVGRTASSWAAFLEVAGAAKSSGQQARAEDAKKRARELEAALPELVIHVAEPDAAGLVVKRGDVVVGRAQWNMPLPVDPGDVTIEAVAPGRKAWRGVVAVQAHEPAQIEIPALEREPMTSPVSAAGPSEGTPNATPEHDGSPFGTQRTIAGVAAALGLVALGAGGIFGAVSISRKGEANTHCDPNNACDDRGLTLRHDAIVAGTLSTVGLLAGGVLAATGITLWFTAPSRTAPSSAVTSAPRARLALRWAGIAFQMELP